MKPAVDISAIRMRETGVKLGEVLGEAAKTVGGLEQGQRGEKKQMRGGSNTRLTG